MTAAGSGRAAGDRLLGRYLLRELIGAGDMGLIWRATDEILHRTVALKQIGTAESGPASDEQVQRIIHEARTAAQLDHPRLLRVLDVITDDDGGVPWLVLQHVEARSWASLCQERAPVEPRAAAHVGAQVAEALVALHRAGIVHGDLTPENVLVDRDGEVKLVDFGGSALISEGVTAGRMTGTRDFRAPEVVAGATPGPAADVYALGAAIHEAVGGAPVVAGTPPTPAATGPLTAVLTGMLRPDPRHRLNAVSAHALLAGVAAASRIAYVPNVRLNAGMTRRVVVVGAGIVGAAVAEQLSRRERCEVTVLDQAPGGHLPGSTGHAPGFVGTLGEAEVLTELARESVEAYRELEWHGQAGFDSVGALELAQGSSAVMMLARRAQAAAAAGLPANLLDPADAVALAPRLVDPAKVEAALHFPLDGTARATVITAAYRARASAAGARFLSGARVTAVDAPGGRVAAVRTPTDVFAADDVVIACGIWGPAVAELAGVELPLIPVAHPYIYSARRTTAHPPSPFVRWPEHHARSPIRTTSPRRVRRSLPRSSSATFRPVSGLSI